MIRALARGMILVIETYTILVMIAEKIKSDDEFFVRYFSTIY